MHSVKKLLHKVPCIICNLNKKMRHNTNFGEKILDRFLWALPIILIFAAWEVFLQVGILSANTIPPPSRIIVTLWNCSGHPVFIMWVLQSLANIIIGVLLALPLALVLAVTTGLRSEIDHTLTPTIMIFGALPDLALLPIFVFWFGPGAFAAILMAMICSFFPIFFSVREGVKEIPEDFFHVTKIFKAGKVDKFTKVVLPAILPSTIAGVRIAFDFVWEIVLAIEIIARVSGIGSFIETSMQSGSMELAFAGIFAIGVLVLTIDRLVFTRAEGKIARWL